MSISNPVSTCQHAAPPSHGGWGGPTFFVAAIGVMLAALVATGGAIHYFVSETQQTKRVTTEQLEHFKELRENAALERAGKKQSISQQLQLTLEDLKLIASRFGETAIPLVIPKIDAVDSPNSAVKVKYAVGHDEPWNAVQLDTPAFTWIYNERTYEDCLPHVAAIRMKRLYHELLVYDSLLDIQGRMPQTLTLGDEYPYSYVEIRMKRLAVSHSRIEQLVKSLVEDFEAAVIHHK